MALTKTHNRMIAGASANVKDFGAVGDGVTDDTVAIQAAIDSGNRVYLPKGTYSVSSSLTLTFDSYLEGEVPEATILSYTGTTGSCIELGRARTTIKNLYILNSNTSYVGVIGESAPTDATATGIIYNSGAGTDRVVLEQVIVRGFDVGLSLKKSVWVSANCCHFESNNKSILLEVTTGAANTDWFNNLVMFSNCKIKHTATLGFEGGGLGVSFTNTEVSNNPIGIYFKGTGAGVNTSNGGFFHSYAEGNPITFKIEDAEFNVVNSFIALAGTIPTAYNAMFELYGRVHLFVDGNKDWGYSDYIYWFDVTSYDNPEVFVTDRGISTNGGNVTTALTNKYEGLRNYLTGFGGSNTVAAEKNIALYSNTTIPATPTRFETDNFGSNDVATLAVDNNGEQNDTYLILGNTRPTSLAGDRAVLGFAYNTSSTSTDSNGILASYIASVTTEDESAGGNIRSSELVFATSNRSVSSAPIQSFKLDATGNFKPIKANFRIGDTTNFVDRLYTDTCFISSGSGSPEGVLTATVGSIYTRTDGGTGTTLYVKESGTGNTGWVAK